MEESQTKDTEQKNNAQEQPKVEESNSEPMDREQEQLDNNVGDSPLNRIPTATSTATSTATPVASSSSTFSSTKYKSIDTFSFDSGSYNSPTVTIYIPFTNIGSHPKSNIQCNFTKSSFDLTIIDLEGGNYRLLKDNLEHDIDPKESVMKIKPNKIILKLQKVKSDYGMYDTWNELTSKKKKTQAEKSKDPAASIMDLMRDMYEQGDDNMKKMIGETMLKQREGRLDSDLGKGMDDLKF
jgi:calcyclin binding protein